MIGDFDDTEDLDSAGDAVGRHRLVTFDLGDELYGVPIVDVAEIREPLPITPLPRVDAHVLGLINVRGTILPVVDLRRAFGLPTGGDGPENRLVILKGAGYQVALRVDAVRGLARLSETSFQTAPSGTGAEPYDRVALVDGRMLVELNVAKLLARDA